MTTKASVFVSVECVICNNKISYFKVEEGDDLYRLVAMTDQYCPACYEKQRKETEGMT